MTSPSTHGDTAVRMTPPLAVVVVAESRARTRALRGLLSGPGFAVAAEVWTAEAAEAAVVAHQPGAVLLDLHPEAGGIEAIERIMGTRPTPIVVCGDLAPHSEDALAAGAVDVIGALDALPSSPQYASAVRRHVRVAARVRVITHPRNRLRARGLSAVEPAAQPRPPAAAAEAPPESRVHVVVIGASTGGPPALATILADLPPGLPVPVLVIQHMADGFVEGLATWLDTVSPVPVEMAQHGRRLLPGRVYIAPAGANTMLRRGLLIELRTPPPGQFHVPGVDATFASTASAYGANVVGVLLTGMGRDGAAGLRKLRDRGALTIGQDEPTSVVWGMPAAAQALGAVELELPLPAIGKAIAAAVRGRTCTSVPVVSTAGG
ncbi:MAG: two-component system, chemotaxis family, protein-glutamate methylesterase/glutaminase [Actinomycetota bacterium]|nr:two-component system, chemotaxis family, protein-glutamate methylesterase/glutaminase [Actinomycetota bacterium]